MDKAAEDLSLNDILKLHPALKQFENGRVKCSLTGHEMLNKTDVVLQHVNGKRYKHLTKNFNQEFNVTQYEPYLVQSDKKGHENQLFCKLTLKHVNKIPHHIERHINGKKFLKAKKRCEECEKTGEKFFPTSSKKPRRKQKEEENGDELEAEGDSDDSFSDLYPEKYFGQLSLDSNDDEEMPPAPQKKANKKRKKKKSQAANGAKEIHAKRKQPSDKNAVSEKKQRTDKPSRKDKTKPKSVLLTSNI